MTDEPEFYEDVLDPRTGETVRVVHWATGANGERVSIDPRLIHLEGCNGATFRAALEGEGLPVSGNARVKAKRLYDAGLDRKTVEEKYGWRARQAAIDERRRKAEGESAG